MTYQPLNFDDEGRAKVIDFAPIERDVQEEILVQLKILNLHMQELTSEVFTEDEII